MSAQPFLFVVTQNGQPTSGLSAQLNSSLLAYNVNTGTITTLYLPTIYEFGTSGRYYFFYDSVANPALLITLDAGATFTNLNERYLSISVLSDASNISNIATTINAISTNGVSIVNGGLGDNAAYSPIRNIISSILVNGNPILTNINGGIQLDLTQNVPLSNTAHTVGDALNAARGDGFGIWKLSGNNLTIYDSTGTVAVRVFTLDNATDPTQRI